MEGEQCYLCYGEDSAETPFALDPRPCACTGSIVLHKACLQRLMGRCAQCSICKKSYNLAYLQTEGEYIVKYINGLKIKYKINILGQKHGPFEIWYDNGNGQLKQRCTYVADKREGLEEQWYENGNIWHRYSLVAGKREGPYEAWHENGKLWMRCNYKDNKLEGLYETFYRDGGGGILQRYNLTNGQRTGLYESWHENGTIASRCNYVNGDVEGQSF